MNKTIVFIFLLFICGMSQGQTVDKEAKIQYDNFIKEYFMVYKGDHYFLKHFNNYGESFELTHMKNVSTMLSTDTISAIEKLNGIEWKGTINIYALAMRNIFWTPQNIIERKWAEWYQFKEVKLQMTKKWGKWKIDKTNFNYSNELPSFNLINDALQSPIRVVD